MKRVEGKVCIVTGAASGIGKADAQLLAAEGAKVVLTDLNEVDGQLVAEAIGKNAIFVKHDISSEEDWQRVIKTALESFGRLDVLVNNAGILALGNIEETSMEQWQKIITVNTQGYFLGCQQAIRVMKESGGGSIINMSSLAALTGLPQFFAYTASKGAVTAMTRSMAVHCNINGYNIRCNTVHPGGVDTPMAHALAPGSTPPSPEELEANPGMCAPEDVAKMVLFLASDDSRFVNGCEIKVDNAQSINGL